MRFKDPNRKSKSEQQLPENISSGLRLLREKVYLNSLAGELGLESSALRKWTDIPAERVVKIAELTGIPPHELRPDIYQGYVRKK